MDEDLAITFVFLAISVTLNLALLVGWFRASRRASRFERRLFSSPVADDRRVEHLESVLDSVASQVDRLASGQEFLSRVVGERSARQPERLQVETPH
ncbi:MAG: hypothetical protein V9E87_15900 [Gemmatimonadales bacterium]